MFNLYEPNVKVTIAFLRQLKVRVNNSTVNETLQNHPDWPSLLSISDSLNKWKISNSAGKINSEDIDQLPLPFIAYTMERGNSLSIVTDVKEKEIGYYSANHNKLLRKNREEFLKKWNGTYLIAEPNKNSGEENYKKHKRKFLITSLIPIALVAALIAFSFFLLQRTINNSDIIRSNNLTGFYFQYCIELAGVIITSLLLGYEIDKNNPILKKVCTGIAKGSCSAVLTSKQAKIFSWLSWSEVGFFYFSGALLLLLFAGNNFLNAATIVSWLNILALPYTIFSVYYQWRIVKQWCVLCLGVQFLLLIGAANIFINLSLVPLSFLSINFISKTLLFYLLPVLFWFTLKPFVLRLQQSKNTKREYLRVKFNSEIFDTLLKKQKTVNGFDDLGINLGNSAASNIIIKVCNPYCGPCAKAHPKIEELLEKNNNVKVKMIFTVANDKEDIRSLPVKHFLALNEKDKAAAKKALDDWYLSEKKDYDSFAKKYPMNGELLLQGDKIEAMGKWCKETGIQFTPTFFVNGYQLPNVYDIEDLEYFLAE